MSLSMLSPVLDAVAQTASPAETPPANEGREKNGRFAKGNRGGPGNPFNRQTAALRKIMLECVTEEHMRTATQALIKAACEGNIAAIRIMYLYAIGKPTEAVDPDRLDIDEWKLCSESNITGGPLEKAWLDGVPVQQATAITNILEETKLERMRQQMAVQEAAQAEEAAAQAVEDAALARANEEAVREYREREAARAAGLPVDDGPDYQQWEAMLGRPLTFHEILHGVPPTANGGIGATAPTANGGIGGPPLSANGGNGGASPSTNGGNGAAGPMANGGNGGRSPSANGGNGRRPSAAMRGQPDPRRMPHRAG